VELIPQNTKEFEKMKEFVLKSQVKDSDNIVIDNIYTVER
jgi:hypothetical protein